MSTTKLLALAFLVGCGTTTGGVPIPDATVVTLTSISVTPPTVAATRGIGTPTQLTATANLSDAKTVDVTGLATWTLTDSTLATVQGGLVTPLLSGTTMVTASYEGQTATAQLTIKNPLLFVTETGAAALGVLVFDGYASGNVAPLRQIIGPTAAFSFPWSIDIANDEIYVSNVSSNSIAVFPIAGSGDLMATRRIVGPTTGLASPYGMVIHGNELFVGSNGKVLVYPLTANGDVAPTRTITGPTTTLTGIVTGLAVSATNELYVVHNTNQIVVFPADANGDVAPTRVIAGPHAFSSGCYDVRIVNNELVVSGTSGVRVFPITATGDASPIRFITGAAAAVPNVTGSYIVGNEIYAVNNDPATAIEVQPLDASANHTPTRGLAGAATQIMNPRTAVLH